MAEVAEKLDKSSITILRWCESGKIPAIAKPYGNKVTYLIAPATLELIQSQAKVKQQVKQKQQAEVLRPQADFISQWIQAMSKGTLTGKAFSKATIEVYEYYVRTFYEHQKVLSVKTLEQELLKIPAHQFGKREKVFKSLLCFSKHLINKGMLENTFLTDIKRLTPKRHLPPKRLTVSVEGLEKLLSACDGLYDEAIVLVLANTGLRASEFCALKLKDLDMQNRVLTVRLAKGGKTRRVGLNETAFSVLERYLAFRQPEGSESLLFLNANNKRLNANGLRMRLMRIGRKADVLVSPHALRRAFVTINANKGRSLVHLQHACGHADITTTRSYCRETEEEVIASMQDW